MNIHTDEGVSRSKNNFWHIECKRKLFCKYIPYWF